VSNEYIYTIDKENDFKILRHDSDGSFLSTEFAKPTTDAAFSKLYESQDYVYLFDYSGNSDTLFQFQKATDGTLTKNWETNTPAGYLVQFAENEDVFGINTARYYEVERRAASDGSSVWSTSYSDRYNPQGSTLMSNGNYVVSFEDTDSSNHIIREYESDSGNVANEITAKNDTWAQDISRDDDGNYVIAGRLQDVYKYDRSGNVIWSVDIGLFYTDEFVRGYNRYYGYSEDDENIYAVSDDGTILWNKSFTMPNVMSLYRDQNGNERVIYFNQSDELYAIDGETGNQVWQGYTGDWYYDIAAYPNYESFPTPWIPTVTLSGTATQSGSGVQGAEIIVIDNDRNVIADRVTTDSSGNWSTEVRDNTLHVVAEYTDGNGDVYNTESYPNVNSN
jgi:hypothetical protein